MFGKQDSELAKEQIKYLEGLVNYLEKHPYDDDSSIDFLQYLVNFKTKMSLKYNTIHKYCNNYVKNFGSL